MPREPAEEELARQGHWSAAEQVVVDACEAAGAALQRVTGAIGLIRSAVRPDAVSMAEGRAYLGRCLDTMNGRLRALDDSLDAWEGS